MIIFPYCDMDFHSYDDDSQLSGVEIWFFFISLRGCMSGLNPSVFWSGPQYVQCSVHNSIIWSFWSAPVLKCVRSLFHQARSHPGTKVVIQILICNSFGFVPSKGPVLPPGRDFIYRNRHSAEMSLELLRIWSMTGSCAKLIISISQAWVCAGLTLVHEPAMRCGFTLLSQRKWWNSGCFSEVTCCCCLMNQQAVRCLIF